MRFIKKNTIVAVSSVMIIMSVSVPVINAADEPLYSWTFDTAEAVTTDTSAMNTPIVTDTAQAASEGYISIYSGHNMSIKLSEPVAVGEDDIVTVEADIAYGSLSGKYTSFSISSSTGTNDLLYSYLCRYSDTKDNSLKLGGIEKLTQKADGTYARPSFPGTSNNEANTTNGWLHYKAVFDYNSQLMTLTLSHASGTAEYTAPLSFETDISLIKFASNHTSRYCYADNVTITKTQSDIPYTPGEKVMSIISEADGDSTTIDTSTLYRDSHVSQYAVYTIDSDGNKLSETKTAADTSITADTSGAAMIEVVPVFRYSDIGDARSEKTLKTEVENGLYNFTFKKEKTPRSDIFVNGAMVANNVDKEGYNRRVSSGSEITAHDIVINDGTVRVKTDDTTADGGRISWCEFYKAPSIANRVKKIYVIGDSLVANYYGTYSSANQNKAQFGWGEVISSFFTDEVEVVNLANGGHYATILETTAFPGVMANAKSGDYLIIESGYNDLKHNTADETQASVERMVNAAKAKGIIPIVVSPNASMQTDDDADDYVESVRYTAAMKAAAESTGALYIDLSGESYKFYREHYGDDRTAAKNTYYFPNEPDYLHHNYLGAMNCARIVAQGMYDAGIGFIDTDYSFTFTDAASNEISLSVDASAEPDEGKCIKITAEYNSDGTLKNISAEGISIKEAVPVNNSDSEKIFYWESIENMKPITIEIL